MNITVNGTREHAFYMKRPAGRIAQDETGSLHDPTPPTRPPRAQQKHVTLSQIKGVTLSQTKLILKLFHAFVWDAELILFLEQLDKAIEVYKLVVLVSGALRLHCNHLWAQPLVRKKLCCHCDPGQL